MRSLYRFSSKARVVFELAVRAFQRWRRCPWSRQHISSLCPPKSQRGESNVAKRRGNGPGLELWPGRADLATGGELKYARKLTSKTIGCPKLLSVLPRVTFYHRVISLRRGYEIKRRFHPQSTQNRIARGILEICLENKTAAQWICVTSYVYQVFNNSAAQSVSEC